MKHVTVKAPNAIVSNRAFSINNQTDANNPVSLKLSPNPTSNILYVYANGLLQNKRSTISVISVSGVIMKTINSNISRQPVQLGVSSLASGVYTIKVVSGDKVMFKQFIKL